MRGFGATTLVWLLLCATAALAQESASYHLREHVLASGGHPAGESLPASAGYRLTLGSIGQGAALSGLSSNSYRLDAGFSPAHPPPLEVHGLLLLDAQTLGWSPEKSIGTYNVYRDLISTLGGPTGAPCLESDLTTESATDPATPPPLEGYYYLVTAVSRLAEEGSRGSDSADSTRPAQSPCP